MQLAYINLLRSVAVIVVVFFHIYALFWQKGIYGLADDCNPWYIMIRCGHFCHFFSADKIIGYDQNRKDDYIKVILRGKQYESDIFYR